MTIAQVAERFNVTTDTLRYYEKVGMIPKVSRTSGGIRSYGEVDMNWVEFIICMRSSGISIEVLKEYVELYQLGESTLEERRQLLIKERNAIATRLHTLQTTLDRLDYKIENYITISPKN